MTKKQDIYRTLQKHLNKMPTGFPPTKSGVEINLLQSIFTLKEAEITTYLDYKYNSIDHIFEKVREDVTSKEELILILDQIVSKGGIFRRKRKGESQYALMPFVLWGMYEHQLKRLDSDFLDNTGKYLAGEMGFEFATHKLPKMRVIPIEKSIKVEHRVATYDELRHLIDQAGEHIAIQDCICKKVFDKQGKPCQTTDRREVCMSFGDLSDLYVEEGWARSIDRDEALEISRKNEEEGLVLMPSNEQKPVFMCACCSDCCGMLGMIKNFPKPASIVHGNFHTEVDAEKCRLSGTCADRCPMDAVKMNGHSTVNLARCIGCGLCVPTCPEGAMLLVKNQIETVPPETVEELYDTILTQKKTFSGKLKNVSLKTMLRVMTRFSN